MHIKSILYVFGIYLILPAPLFAYDKDHLESLLNQVKKGTPVQCQGFDLQDADLTDLNLRGADFSKANLRRANLSRANLQGADFTTANLNKAKFWHADLTQANLTEASVKGTKFKNSQLLGIQYETLVSVQGSLFADKKNLLFNLKEEKKIKEIEEDFLQKNKTNCITCDTKSSLQEMHAYFYKILSENSIKNMSHSIVDFSPLFSPGNGAEFSNAAHIVQDFIGFFRSPFFRPFVKGVTPILDNKRLIVFHHNQDANSTKNLCIPKDRTAQQLDLHGNSPWETKCNLMDQFIKEAYRSSRGSVDIITGRGLHNAEGKMGVLWRRCKRHLLSEKFKNYIQGINSINQDGGWKILLKKRLHKKHDFKKMSVKKSLDQGEKEKKVPITQKNHPKKQGKKR